VVDCWMQRRRANARILLRMRIGMHETPSSGLELPRSFLRDWVAAVYGVGIPGNLEPGQAEACPHTAAMTQHSRRKKSASSGDGGALCVRQVYQRVPTPGHGIFRDLGESRPDGAVVQGVEPIGISLKRVGFFTGDDHCWRIRHIEPVVTTVTNRLRLAICMQKRTAWSHASSPPQPRSIKLSVSRPDPRPCPEAISHTARPPSG